jgi:putative Mn2+ efflux pump MntP
MISGLLGLDNIAVAFALGPLQIGPRRALLLGLWFGIAEAAMTLLGSVLGAAWLPAAMATEMTRAGVLATLAAAVLGLAWIRRQPAAFVASPWALMGLALLLGIDNLIAGAAPDVAALPPAAIVAAGALTGALAAAACAAGSAVFRPAPRWGAVASSVMLLGLAVAGIV